MKIEKGKLYYNNQLKCVIKAIGTGNRCGDFTDKIAVICNSEEDWKYVKEKLPYLRINNTMKHNIQKYEGATLIGLNEEGGYCNLQYYTKHGFHIMPIEIFKEFHPDCEEREVKVGDVLNSEEGDYLVTDVSQIPQASPEEIINNFKNGGFTFVNSQTDDLNSDEENSFKEITNSIAELLEYKNAKYGNAVLEPLNIFSGKCKAGTRIDDKLSRIKNSKEGLRKNDVCDLIGYLILSCKENNWTDFSEFKD